MSISVSRFPNPYSHTPDVFSDTKCRLIEVQLFTNSPTVLLYEGPKVRGKGSSRSVQVRSYIRNKCTVKLSLTTNRTSNKECVIDLHPFLRLSVYRHPGFTGRPFTYHLIRSSEILKIKKLSVEQSNYFSSRRIYV